MKVSRPNSQILNPNRAPDFFNVVFTVYVFRYVLVFSETNCNTIFRFNVADN